MGGGEDAYYKRNLMGKENFRNVENEKKRYENWERTGKFHKM